MPTTATIRSTSRTDDTTAATIAELWNAAYPTMRAIATARVAAYRQQIEGEVWRIDPNHPQAEAIAPRIPTEATTRRRLKNAEDLRRALHQLDNGTHRACTRSPGGFSLLAAYAATRSLLDATSLNDHGLAAIYRLAAALADASDERHRELAANPPAA